MSAYVAFEYAGDLFPLDVSRQRQKIVEAAGLMGEQALVWISENRDYGEVERYHAKDDVDEALLASAVISEERGRVEELFAAHDPVKATELYLDLARRRLAELHAHFASSIVHPLGGNVNAHQDFWRKAVILADLDNAHAMYLSSNNWDFSVFDDLIEAIQELIGPDIAKLNPLLTAGIQDSRTAVYTSIGAQYRGMNRDAFVRAVATAEDWIRDDGIMPLMAFQAATDAPEQSHVIAQDLYARYQAYSVEIAAELDARERERFKALLKAYERMYAARALYDIYEYFGFYAFARNAMIFQTTQMLESRSKEMRERFWYSASTYQFVELTQLIENF